MSYPTFREFLREANLTRTSPVLPRGARVKVPHRGRMVNAKVIRYDKGDPHGWPFYVVDVGEYESPKVPVDKVRVESRTSMTEAAETFSVVAIDDPAPAWKRGYGHTPEHKVVWQMWGLEKKEIVLAAKMAREKHPHATVSVENQSGKIVKVFKPGQSIHELIKKPWPPGPTDPDDGGNGDGDAGNGDGNGDGDGDGE